MLDIRFYVVNILHALEMSLSGLHQPSMAAGTQDSNECDRIEFDIAPLQYEALHGTSLELHSTFPLAQNHQSSFPKTQHL
ncbi:hypothetical protein G4B88_008311 [Cannabis sativa]|uniref:Uncharacterized protein n=1 Tax=Cannabis sativa TaxID=3483 RepID=A0A7J6G776_CANSA|nr:hypothetical protein G4B88_008311 [Cannabis sativa]